MRYVTRGQRGGSAVNRMTWSYVSKIYVRISGKVLRLNIKEYKLAAWLDSRTERWVVWLVVPAVVRVRRLTAAIVIQYKTIIIQLYRHNIIEVAQALPDSANAAAYVLRQA